MEPTFAPYVHGMQRRTTTRHSTAPVGFDLGVALQQFEDDGGPRAPKVRAWRRSGTRGEQCAFTIRDSTGEPRRDDRELGGEA